MNILIVDDEAMIREWMTFTLNNLPVEINLIETAADGLEALEVLQHKSFDLVFIDITMPRLDGIGLIKEMNTLPNLPMTVVLSSHDQFNYAREAFHYNASEYLLKSECNKEKLLELIRTCQENLSQKQLKSNLSFYRSSFLSSIINNSFHPSPVSIANLFPELVSQSYFVIVYNRNEPTISKNTLLFKHSNRVFIGNSHNLSFFAYSVHKNIDIKDIEEVLINSTKDTNLQIGCSKLYHSIDDLKNAIQGGYIAKQLLFYCEDNFSIECKTDLSTNVMSDINQQCALILNYIKTNDLDQARDNLSVLHHIITLNTPDDISIIKNINYNILSALLVNLSKNTHQVMPDLDALQRKMEKSQRFSEIKAYTDEYFYFVNPIQGVTSDINSHYILESINYIHTKYTSIESISQIANRVHLNTDYFSRLFKKEVGIPASTYLMNYKLEIAADKLLTTSDTVYEIGVNLGYNNISYFSKIFKAKYDLQPSQYRKQFKS